MLLEVLTKENCEQLRQWRNQDISIYRTSFLLTKEMQENFYSDIICDRRSPNRFWAIIENADFIGMIGLINISFENRNAEISIVIDPEKRGKGIGEKALELLLDKGFNELNLENIYGECYYCNKAIEFWRKMIEKYKADKVIMPARKYYKGDYHNSIYFTFNKKLWRS